MTTSTPTLVLIACSQSKQDCTAAPAAELYTGQLFQASRRFAESHGYTWRILSAHYGLLRPDAQIGPYDKRLAKGRGGREADAWAGRVEGSLCHLCATEGIERVIWLAGQDYRNALHYWRLRHGVALPDWLAGCLRCQPMAHEIPGEGLGIGQQLQWLKRNRAGRDVQASLF